MTRRISIVCLLIFSFPVLEVSSASAAPPRHACTVARLHRVETTGVGANREVYRCDSAVTTSGRTAYRWTRVTLAPQAPTRTTQDGAACLALGDLVTMQWLNDVPAFWQSVLNQKTGSNTNSFLTVLGAYKAVSFAAGRLIFTSQIETVSVPPPSDPNAPRVTALGIKTFVGQAHVDAGFIVIDSVSQNTIVTTLTIGGVSGPSTTTRQHLEVGDRLPFKCDNNVLAISEPGLNGLVTTTYGLRSFVPPS